MKAWCETIRGLAAATVVAVGVWATTAVPAGAASEPLTRADVEAIVHDYVLAHPEVILESINKMRERQQMAEERQQQSAAAKVRPVAVADHVLGSPDAPVKIIEFSDLECPFCKRFQATLHQVMDEYGRSGKVAWVFRHFPIDSLHPKARKEAQAAECANELGGQKAFWAYIDGVFAVTPSNNGLDLSLLPGIAEKAGLDRRKFESCLQGDARGGKFAALIEADIRDGEESGGTGTPYSIVVSRSGKTFPISGAQPYAAVKAIIDVALKGE